MPKSALLSKASGNRALLGLSHLGLFTLWASDDVTHHGNRLSFGEQRDTIMSGILFLLGSGSWALAAIVFIASIFVPLAKLICLTYLLVTIHKGKPTKRLHRTRLYRMLEFVGRWSMLDVYVVTLLSVLVQLKGLANIYPMPGAMAFGAVVVLTMMATLSFDPRLIWDAALDQHQTIPESK